MTSGLRVKEWTHPIVDLATGRPTRDFYLFLNSLYGRVGGDTAPSNTDLNTGIEGANAAIGERVAISSLGGDASVSALASLSLGKQINRPGLRVLWLSASASGARCHNEYGIDETTYSRTTATMVIDGVSQTVRLVEFNCGGSFVDCDSNRRTKVAAPKRADLTAICRVIDSSDLGGGSFHIRCIELYGDDSREDVPLGSVTDNAMAFHDLQSNSNTHTQIAKANGWLGGALDVTPLGIGGSNTDTWADPALRAYILSIAAADGPFDRVVLDDGYGNNITDPQASSADILAALDLDLGWAEDNLGRDFAFLEAGAARLGGDDHPVPNPELTADFTTLQITGNALRTRLASKHRAFGVIPLSDDFFRASSYGLVDTADITRGEPPLEFVSAKDGIHLAPTGNDEAAFGIFEYFEPITPQFNFASMTRSDFRYINTTPDVGGAKNPNFLYPWFGAVPTTSVSFLSYIVGNGIEGTSCGGSGFSGSQMDGTLSVIALPEGGVGMRMDFVDSRDSSDPNPNPTLRLFIRNVNAFPIVNALNDADLQGVDCDFFGCFEMGGFKQDSIFAVNVALVGIDADSKAWKIASLLCDDGIHGMSEDKRAWCNGINPDLLRAGNGAIRIPSRTYVDAYILVEIVGTPVAGYPMGAWWFEVSRFQLKERQAIL